MDDIICRRLSDNELEAALSLVWQVFLQYDAPSFGKEGTQEFKRSISDKSWQAELTVYGAFDGGELVGTIASRKNGRHIALFFVRGDHQRRGIGRRLFEALLRDSTSDVITVNAAPPAVAVYQKLGFEPTGDQQSVNGVKFTPMALQRQIPR